MALLPIYYQSADLEEIIHDAEVVGLIIHVVYPAVSQAYVVTQLVHEGAALFLGCTDAVRPAAERDNKAAPGYPF